MAEGGNRGGGCASAGSLALAAMLACVAAACAGPEEAGSYHYTRFSMETVVEYTLVAPSREAAQAAMTRAHAEMERVAALLWEEDARSQIYAVNHAGGRIAVGPEAARFLQRAKEYAAVTGGAFDVTIKPVLDLYDFEAASPVPPSDAALAAQLPRVGMEHLRLAPPAYVERTHDARVAVGGVAKGYAVDRAVQVLRDYGITQALVNAGGDLYCLGTRRGRPWAVGIRHPDDPAALIDTLYVSDRAVATSGDYQRYFMYGGQRYHHLLDPRDGRPARRSRSATVVAGTTEEADALATAVFVAGPEAGIALLERLPGVEGMVVGADGTMTASSGYAALSSPPAETP
jgi:thiamine biosynthesis lipoprotein